MSELQAQNPMLPGGGDVESGGGSLGVYFAKPALRDHWGCIESVLEGRRVTEFKGEAAKEQYLNHPGDTLLVGWPVSARLDSKLDALAKERKARGPCGKTGALLMRTTSERTGLSTSSSFDFIIDFMPKNQASRDEVARRLAHILPVDLPLPAAVGPESRTRNAGCCSRKAKVLLGLVILIILLGVALWKLKTGDGSPSPKRNGILLRHRRNNTTPYFTANVTKPFASKLISNVTSKLTSNKTYKGILKRIETAQIDLLAEADLAPKSDRGRTGSAQEVQATSYSEPQPMTEGLPDQASEDDETPWEHFLYLFVN